MIGDAIIAFETTSMHDVRPPAVAGSWYPSNREQLAKAVDGHLAAASVGAARPCPRAIVAPHAGLMYSGPVAAHAYTLLRQCTYSVVVLVGPSHFVGFDGVSMWARGAWDTPLGTLAVADRITGALAAASRRIVEHPAAHAREHSLEMQLPFVARLFPHARIVPLVMGYQRRDTAHTLGDALARVIASHKDEDILLVASSDLSHYEEATVAFRLDTVVMERVAELDADGLMDALEREPRHACGGGPMVSVLRAAAQLGCTEARVMRYADSGDVSGDKTSVVGYMAAAIW